MTNRHQSTEQYVTEILRNRILTGKYKSGDRLRQNAIADELGVSSTPVREAFRGLRAEGLIQLDTNRGVSVRGLTTKDLIEIYEIRIQLEPMLTRKASYTILPERLNDARALYQDLCTTKDPHEWARLNKLFHLALMDSQEDSRLFQIVKGLMVLAEPYVALSFFLAPSMLDIDNVEHKNILSAFNHRDDILLETLVRSHLEHTRDAIIELIPAPE